MWFVIPQDLKLKVCGLFKVDVVNVRLTRFDFKVNRES